LKNIPLIVYRYTVPASDIPSVTNCLNVKNRLNPGPSSAYSHTPTFTSRKRGDQLGKGVRKEKREGEIGGDGEDWNGRERGGKSEKGDRTAH
jgi:hypothetical protein